MKNSNGAVLSMTGFGSASGKVGGIDVNAEIRSLNSKGSDVNIKIPLRYREREMEIRSVLSNRLMRGKIDLYVSVEQEGDSVYSINEAIFDQYHKQVKKLYNKTKENPKDMVSVILRLPDVVKAGKGECTEQELDELMQLIDRACSAVMDFRSKEGIKLQQDVTARLTIITQLINEAEVFEPERIQAVKDRLQKAIDENGLKGNYDTNRFEQEMIYYLEKIDMNEEKVRLRTHCRHFSDVLLNEKAQGRKLNFIAQEMGREINTMGSKANHAGIQTLVVRMKDELEKIKEQTLNIL